MKFALDHKRLHLRFSFGTRFALFVAVKALKRKDPAAAEVVRALGKEIGTLLKRYKRAYGRLNILEIESRDEDGETRILLRL